MGGGLYSRLWHQEGLETNPIQFVPHSIQVSCRRLHVPPRVPTHTPTHIPTVALPTYGPQPGPLFPPRPSWQRAQKPHFTPGEGRLYPATFGAKDAPCARGTEVGDPLCLPSSSSHPTFFIIPLQRPPAFPRNTHLTNNSYHPRCFH